MPGQTASINDASSSEQSSGATPFIYEEDGRVTLHFQIGEVQSQMDSAAPDALVLPYTVAMMGFLLFAQRPRHIAMLGLGGGSIAKFCYRHLPHSQITVAEISPEVIALRDQFYIPGDDHRLEIVCEDGAQFVNRHARAFGVLLVDAFDVEGQPESLCTRHFYDDCYNALAPGGVLVVNLCDHRSRILTSRIRQSFCELVIVLPCPGSENKIVVAGKGDAFRMSQEGIARAIENLTHRFPLATDWTAIASEVNRLLLALAPRFREDGDSARGEIALQPGRRVPGL